MTRRSSGSLSSSWGSDTLDARTCSRRRVSAGGLKRAPLQKPFKLVEAKNSRSSFADLSYGNDGAIFSETKMIAPRVQTRMVEPDQRRRAGRHRCDITSFVPVTKEAGVSQIGFLGGTTVFYADYMIDLTTEERIAFMDEAVLTDIFGVHRHPSPEFGADTGHAQFVLSDVSEICCRARTFARRIICSSCK